MTDKQIDVLLVDDHVLLRDGLRALLDNESDIKVIAEAGTAEQAIQLAKEINPDIIVMDLGLPGRSGFFAIREIRQTNASVGIVVLTMHSDPDMVTEAIEAGGDGYVPKSSAHINLLNAIRTVNSGERFLHPIAASAIVDELLDRQEESKMVETLSDREKQVLKLHAMGFTSREIGEQLSLSPKTIDTYKTRATEKLNLEHRSDVIRFALRAGLLEELEK